LPSSASLEVEVAAVGVGVASLPPEAWRELLALCQDESADRALLERLLDHWRVAHGAAYAAVYLERQGRLELELTSPAVGAAGLPGMPGMAGPRETIEIEGLSQDPDTAAAAAAAAAALHASETGMLAFPGGCLRFSPHPPEAPGSPARPARESAAGAAGAAGTAVIEHGPLPLLLLSSLKILRLRQEIKEQQFQVNYRVVELESLYDVGLAVAATLDLEKLSEEILLRAVSLLDARRGALYILEGSRYRLQRTFGGDAAPWFESPHSLDTPETSEGRRLRAFLAGESQAPPSELLPGARYLLGVPIDIDGSPRGLLAVGDKESRRGVGPFPASDRRTLGLFANQAAIALENARLHLQALEKERLEREMQLAADIQRRILPRGAPEVPGYELLGWNRPARQIGGDYYDLFQRQDGRVGLVVGDVSGKGMPAALMVSTLHSALHLLLDQVGVGPALLEMLNRHVFESSTSNKFITLLLAELEPASGRLTYLNAGHNPGMLLRCPAAGAPAADIADIAAGAGPGAQGSANGLKVEELGASGLPIGVLAGSRFQARSVTLEPGDLLCIYSDGITEAESPSDEEFGTARLLALLRQHAGRPLAEVLEAIQGATGSFSAGLPQGDDQTLVLLRRTPL
jgi:sigma-B regulation protein RsbU (phosphoserine phosphatase)